MSISPKAHLFRILGVSLLVMSVLVPSMALAQSTVEPMAPTLRRNEFMITAHARAAFAPAPLLGLWFDEHARSWRDGQRNMAYGGDFVWRLRGDYELGVSLDYADLSLPGQYWKQKNEEVDEASFTTVDLKLLSATFTTAWYWDVTEWLSPYLGAGIGVAYLAGEGIVEYDPVKGSACDTGRGQGESFTPEACYGADGKADPAQVDQSSAKPADRVPPVIPVVHVSGGLRFNIAQYGVIKLEVGLNDYTYVGLSVGGQWW